MNERVRMLSEEAAKLTPEERIELVEQIGLTLIERQTTTEDAWDAEAHRRFAAYDRGEIAVYSWAEIMRRRDTR